MSHLLDIPAIRASLDTARVGTRIEYVAETTSTSDEAWRILDLADRDGSLSSLDGLTVLAEHQTCGRGRLGRTWHAPRGAALLCSVALIDSSRRHREEGPVLLAAVAACDAITRTTEVKPHIKWPNDLLVRSRKIAGILIESRVFTGGCRVYLCGLGINCLQQSGHFAKPLRERATSLDLESALPVDRSRLAAALLQALDDWRQTAERQGPETLRDAWLARCEPLGQHVVLRHRSQTYSGTTIDIDPSAALVLQLDQGGRRAFPASDTTLIHPDSE